MFSFTDPESTLSRTNLSSEIPSCNYNMPQRAILGCQVFLFPDCDYCYTGHRQNSNDVIITCCRARFRFDQPSSFRHFLDSRIYSAKISFLFHGCPRWQTYRHRTQLNFNIVINYLLCFWLDLFLTGSSGLCPILFRVHCALCICIYVCMSRLARLRAPPRFMEWLSQLLW